MSSRKKIKQIPAIDLSQTKKLNFSFEYYDHTSSRYCLSCWSAEDIRNALLRLKEISMKSFNELSNEGRRVYHFGEVDWNKTTEKSGFPDPKVRELPAFHFALLGINSQRARVFGAYSAGTFYIVWFDLNHKVWPSFLKHT